MNHVSCEGCVYHLGGGYCRINLEDECEAGEYEMYEAAQTLAELMKNAIAVI